MSIAAACSISMSRGSAPRLVPIRREHVRGFMARKPLWLMKSLSLEAVRQQVWEMEEGAYRFYMEAAKQTTDVEVRKLLGDLAAQERQHADARRQARSAGARRRRSGRLEKSEEHRQFVLTYVQPGLAGLMDGSVSTLAPVFAAAFATGDTGRPSSSASPPPSAPAFRWALPKPRPTMAS